MGRLVWACTLAYIVACILSHSIRSGYCQHMKAACDKSVIIDIYSGEPVSLETMLDDVATARIVYLGELHTIQPHHDFQLMLLRGLFDRGRSFCLGMEMFTADQQEILDRWLAGNKSVTALGEQLGKEKWNNLSNYEGILVFARDNGIRVMGLNASNDVVRKMARGQVKDLTHEEQNGLPQEDMLVPNPQYDRLLRMKLRVHKAFQGKPLDAVIRAQLLRDAVMAQTIIRGVESIRDKDAAFVAIAGSGHLSYGFGIPERVKKKIQVSDRIILPTESGQLILSDEERRQAVPVEITHEDLRLIREPIADYLYVLPLTASDAKAKTDYMKLKPVK